jgi:hypothetical protein
MIWKVPSLTQSSSDFSMESECSDGDCPLRYASDWPSDCGSVNARSAIANVTIMPPLDFSNDPKDRPKTLHIHQKEPFNAEPEDLDEFIKHFITPTHLVYGRNHGPIPDINEKEYVLTVDGVVKDKLNMTLSDLKAMPKTDVVASLQVHWHNF